MGYKIETITEQNNTPDIVLGFDSVFSNNSVFKPLYLTDDQAVANLKNLLLTRKGERYEQPNFGTDLLNILFEPTYDEIKIDIEDILTSAINFWLPYINIENLDIQTAADDPNLLHNIKIQLSVSVSGFSTRTITILADESGQLEISSNTSSGASSSTSTSTGGGGGGGGY